MTDESRMSEEEIERRLEGLRAGPWYANASHALVVLRPPAWVKQLGTGQLPAHPLGFLREQDFQWLQELQVTFQPHWLVGKIKDREMIRRRDSLDEALEYLQLLELAIESGYLPEERVLPVALEFAKGFLWSEAAWEFVRSYQYYSVQFLMARLGFGDGVQPPPPDPSGELAFAGFLSAHEGFRSNPAIDGWLAFMDDYVLHEGEQLEFMQFLSAGLVWHRTKLQKPSSRTLRFHRLLAGLVDFVQELPRALAPLEDELLPRFGMFYSYWLAKFFGPKSRATAPLVLPFASQLDWAEATLNSPILSFAALDKDLSTKFVTTYDFPAPAPVVAGAPAETDSALQAPVDSLRYAWLRTQYDLEAHQSVSARKGDLVSTR